MNDKTIIEFSFRIILRIMEISEGVVHQGWLTTPSIPKIEKSYDDTQPHPIIVIIIHSKYFPNSDWLKAHV